MVYIYRGQPSASCALCRARRLKCDQRRPSCSQCLRVKRECSGYRDLTAVRFYDQSEEVIGKAQKRSSLPKPSTPSKPCAPEPAPLVLTPISVPLDDLSCRSRRKKCDEKKPRCAACIRNKLRCKWPAESSGQVSARLPRETTSAATRVSQTRRVAQCGHPTAAVSLSQVTQEQQTIVLLSPLTTIHIGRLAIRRVTPAKALTQSLMSDLEQSSYLFDIPCRLGNDDAIDTAVQCVTIAFHDLCTSRSPHGSISPFLISLHTKALKSLRHAFDDPARSRSAETLCATALLCLFEYLNKDVNQAWVHHASGMAQLIKHRGPANFTTDFEKSLLMSQVGIILTESFFNNTPCFLEQEEWMCTLRSSLSPDDLFSSRSKMIIALYEIMIPFARIIAECSVFIMDPNLNDRALHNSLRQKVFEKRQNLLLWKHKMCEQMLLDRQRKEHSQDTSSSPDALRRLENLLTGQANILLCNRLCVALDRNCGHLLEPQTQNLAASMLCSQASHGNNIREVNITLSLATAHAVLQTAEEWNMSIRNLKAATDASPDPVEAAVFRNYMELVGVRMSR